MSNEVKWMGNQTTKELGDIFYKGKESVGHNLAEVANRLDRMNKVKELRRKQKQEKMLHRYLEV